MCFYAASGFSETNWVPSTFTQQNMNQEVFNVAAETKLGCVIACITNNDCHFFGYKKSTKECQGFESINNNNIYAAGPTTALVYKRECSTWVSYTFTKLKFTNYTCIIITFCDCLKSFN